MIVIRFQTKLRVAMYAIERKAAIRNYPPIMYRLLKVLTCGTEVERRGSKRILLLEDTFVSYVTAANWQLVIFVGLYLNAWKPGKLNLMPSNDTIDCGTKVK